MKQYQLNKENYIEEPDLSIIHIYNKTWLESYKDSIQLLIEYFNQEYTWNDMFTLEDAMNRILINGDNLFLLFMNTRVIGYVWFKEIDSKTTFGYNLYVTKKIDRPKSAPKWFYNKVSGIMLKNYKTIKVEIEDWNKVVFDLVESIGYKEM
jgi:Asp-tRNA(Asn)/Glu-tRNA(Gln) amidotransferase B subunit